MQPRARIVHVYKDVYPPVQGGVERIINLLARYTRDEFDVRIIVASRTRRGGEHPLEPRLPDIKVIEVPSLGRMLSTPLAPGFGRALEACRADLLHFHIPHPTGEFSFLYSGLPTPAVATYHSDVVRQRWAMKLYNPFFQRFLGRLDRIMPTSRRYLDTSTQLTAHRERCQVVPLGYELEAYVPTESTARRSEALRRRHGDFLLFLGCLRAYKGLIFLLEALQRLAGVRLVIAGDGVMREELEARAGEMGLADRVVFAGYVSDEEAVALLHAARVFVLPSHQRSEAFGLCQIEAMACGLPVISTDLPTGVPEVNRHGETGLVVPPANSAALAEAIHTLLNDPARRRAMGEAGRRRAEAHYHARIMADQVKGVYRDVLAKRGFWA